MIEKFSLSLHIKIEKAFIMKQEIWKPIKNASDYYISNLGNVKRVKSEKTKSGYKRYYDIVKERLLKHDTSVKGYHTVHIPMNDGKTRHLRVHRLVAEAFIPNPNSLPQVNHIDGIKDNNYVTNLEWCKSLENVSHARDNNLWTSNYELGEKNKNSKLTEFQVLQIPDLVNQGYSSEEIAKKFNVSRSSINLIKRGINWKYLKLFDN